MRVSLSHLKRFHNPLYDYVLERYGVTTSRPDFMGRSSKLSLARAINTDSISDNAKIFSIAAIAVAGMAGIGMMLVFRRKKAVK